MGAKLIMAGFASAAVLLSCAGTAVAARGGIPPAGASEPGGADDRSRRLCRTVVPSGSRLGTRVCRPRADWESQREQTRRYVEDGQTNGYRRDGEFNSPK